MGHATIADANSRKRKRDTSESTSAIWEVAESSSGAITEGEENVEHVMVENVVDTTGTEKSQPNTEEVMKLLRMTAANLGAAKVALDLVIKKLSGQL